ncbi:MAG: aldolase, partial [Gemmatimonadetes bacterium]|nr:aldolase [Gemmatimonadota bacterium]
RIETCEIHLATNFQSLIFDHPKLPAPLRKKMYDWLDENAQSEKKAGDTPEQFYYKARKKAIGPFKKECWGLPADVRAAIGNDLQKTFTFLFDQLKVNGTADLVRKTVHAPVQHHTALSAVGALAEDDPDAGE